MKTTILATAITLAVSTTAFSADLKFQPGSDSRFNWESYEQLKKVDLKGETLTIFGPWLTEDKALIESVIAYFEAATGAVVKYSGSDSFEQQVVIDVQAGSAPNISIFPQPGLAADLASKGFLTPLDNKTADWVKSNYAAGSSWVDLGTFAGKDKKDHLFGFFYKVDLKSLVWYIPENFEDAGYEVPKSMEELKALTDQIVADGGTPWCIGLGSGGATGWPATDWVEDLMLRTQSPADYDKWVTNELKFNDKKSRRRY
jgi:alpha-glucoside transport system substrate-binding protein